MNPFLANIPKPGTSNPLLSNIPKKGTSNPLLSNIPKAGTPNPLLSNVVRPNPVLQTPVPSSYASTMVGPKPVAQVAPKPVVPAPLYSGGITSDATEMAKNRAKLAQSISNLTPSNFTGINLATNNLEVPSNLISAGTTREDIASAIAEKQAKLAAGDQSLTPTSGYQKFLQDYSSKVQYSPEQQLAYTGMSKTSSDIADIQRSLQNRQASLSQQGQLSPAQAAADMAQYTREANARIADLQSSQRDYTLTFNALEAQRKNTLDAFGIQAPFYKPVEISPGSQIIDPSTGQPITSGTGVSPSTAISYASQLYQNDLTNGQVRLTAGGQVDNDYYFNQAQQQLSGRSGLGGGATPIGGGMAQDIQVPSPIKAATSYIGDTPYIDAGLLNSNQMSIAQSYSANTGIPLLSEKDATKLKEASAIFSTADTLVSTLEKNGQAVFQAQSALGVPLQIAKIKLGSLLRTSPEAQIFEQTRSAFLAQLAKAAGEKGVLTDPDIERIKSATPNSTDTIESAALKINQLRGIYEDVKNGAVSAYIGSKKPQSASKQQMVQTSVGAINTNW